MKNKFINGYWSMVTKALQAKSDMISVLNGERQAEGASHFVEILVAIVIVIAIGGIFKNQIISFVNSITNQATTKAGGLF